LGCVIWQKIIEITTGISIPYTVTIGAGLYIGHYGTIILHPATRMGENCNISQGVTVGVSGRGEKRGVPVIGNRVYIGTNAVIVGKIVIGDDVVIGANSLVNRDVPSHCTVLGVPAVIVSQKGSSDYISPVSV
jgi:serine O-acetyltransferase